MGLKPVCALNQSQGIESVLVALPATKSCVSWERNPSHSASHVERGLPKTLKEQTDEELMLLCQADRNEALEELFRRYSRPLFQFVYRQIPNEEMAADLVQETFLRVFNHRKTYKPTARFSYWIYRIARNLTVDEKRRYWNRNVTDASSMPLKESFAADYFETQSSPLPDSAEVLHQREIEHMVRQAIEELSEEQRQVMILLKYQGLQYKEIAEILGVSTESVKQRAYRAHLKLRGQLKHLLQDKEV